MRPLWKAHIAPSLRHEQMADCLKMKTYFLCGITLLIWLSCAGVALTWTQKPSSPSSRPEAGGIRLQQFFSRVQGQYTNAHAEHTHKTYATCSTALHHTAPHCTALHHTALHCTAPHHTTPHHTTLQGLGREADRRQTTKCIPKYKHAHIPGIVPPYLL